LKWLNNIFKSTGSKKEFSNISLSDLDALLAERTKDPEFEEEIIGIYAEVASLAKKLSKDASDLGSLSPDLSNPPRLLNAGMAARDAMINHLESLSLKLNPPDDVTIDSASDYHSKLVNGLGNTVQKFGKAHRYVAALFPREAEKISSDLNRLSRLLVNLNDTINKRKLVAEEIDASRKLLVTVHDQADRIEAMKKDLANRESSIDELQILENKIISDLDRFKSSEEGHKARALCEILEERRSEIMTIEAEAFGLVAPLTKAISRIVKLNANDKLELQHRPAIELLPKEPLKALKEDIRGPLLELKSKADLLGLKEKKQEKILEYIDRLIEDKMLEALEARHSEISKAIRIIEKDLGGSQREIKIQEERLAQTTRQIESLKTSVDQTRESLTRIEEKASRDKRELKARVEKMAGVTVTLDIDSLGEIKER
jgi:DNA repair exonuclease SbcCD ATPase subunit